MTPRRKTAGSVFTPARIAFLAGMSSLLCLTMAFKAEEFRYCKDSSFCRRHRAFDGTKEEATYSLSEVKMLDDNTVQGELHNLMDKDRPLKLTIAVFSNGVFRVTVDELKGIKPRYHVQDVLIGEVVSKPVKGELSLSADKATVTFGGRTLELALAPGPFKAVFKLESETVLSLNSRNLLKFEVYRDKGEEGALEDITGINDGLWEESFKAHRDSRPHGPASVGIDVDFEGVEHVYGLSERASRFSLPNTKGEGVARDEPYRLYNLDVFEYAVSDDRAHQALYGSVPLMLSHTAGKSGGMLFLNGAEMYVDVEDGEKMKRTHWFSESGVMDLFLMAAKTPTEVQGQYAQLVGTQFMPPLFALGYHQCRWNYKDEADVREVDAKFDEHDIPYDVLWLDIEHTIGKRYMTWDRHLFPNPEQMQQDLASRGRKTVVIIDPHLKVDSQYAVYSEAKRQGFFVKNKDGKDFEGHCWPGGSSWLDYLSAEVRDYWASRFLPTNYAGSTEHLYTWNDMNEPSVFNGPEITMQKDLLHHGDIEHRDVHNLYGYYMTMATQAGQQLVRPGRRPFILSRAFFAGSQRYAAVWTGDNMAEWSHLQAATPMLLQLSMTGIQFCGADVGGFFGNPEPELLVRWYQAAAYTPFFRGHAHIDTKRREPWLFGDAVTAQVRSALRARYRVLPYIYSLFHRAHATGTPILRPLWMEFPADTNTFGTDDAFMLGSALLVKPVAAPNTKTTDVYLPAGTNWYPFKAGLYKDVSEGDAPAKKGLMGRLFGGKDSGSKGIAHAGGATVNVECGIDDGIPVFQRAGSIVPARERARRGTAAMMADPYTVHVALDEGGSASGELYIDDGDSMDYAKGDYDHFALSMAGKELSYTRVGSSKYTGGHVTKLERVVVYGIAAAPASVSCTPEGGAKAGVEFTYDKEAQVLVLRNPGVAMNQAWKISF